MTLPAAALLRISPPPSARVVAGRISAYGWASDDAASRHRGEIAYYRPEVARPARALPGIDHDDAIPGEAVRLEASSV
jgi:hypothetical protein